MKIFKSAIIFSLINIFSFTIQAQESLTRLKVTKEISVAIPESFTQMTDAELFNKYISDRKPIAMYTSQDKRADFGINENSSPWAGNDLEILKSFYKANMGNLFTKVDFLTDEVQTIGNRQFAVLEFVSVLEDENSIGTVNTVSKYTYIQYTIRNGKVLLFNFTCPALQQKKWENTAKEIMQSIRIKS